MIDRDFKSGLIPEKNLSPLEYVAGSLTPLTWKARVTEAGKFWLPFIPVREVQNNNNLDKLNCTTMATNNSIETDLKEITGDEINISDRFVAKASGNTKQGNYMSYPIEAIMRCGFLMEDEYPEEYKINPPSWDEYYKDLTPELYKKAFAQLEKYEFDREFIYPTNDKDKLYQCLHEAPISATVSYASSANPEDILNPTTKVNHNILIVNAVYGKYWEIFDSYSWLVGQPTLKRYAWNYQFSATMRIKVSLKNNSTNMQFKQNYPYLLVEGKEQKLGFYLDGRMIIDADWSKIMVQSASRLKAYVPAIPVKIADWNSIPHVNLKGETIA